MQSAALVVFIALAVAALLVADRAGESRRALWFKVAASLGFVFLGLTQARVADGFDRFLMLGLICAAMGDVALALPGERAFLAGVAAFAACHLAYAAGAAVYAWPQDAPGYAQAIWLPSIVAYRWLFPKLGAMRVPVAAYVLIISVMVVGALAVHQLRGDAGRLFALGAVLFYASDLSVARDRFVRSAFFNRAWGLPAYYAAQICIALSMDRL